jgi:hypothetical protein
MRFFNSNNLDKITAEQGQQIIISHVNIGLKIS